MTLSDLLAGCSIRTATGNLDTEILGIAHDSREVSRGSAFVAIRGLKADGNHYVAQAVAAGAAAVISTAFPETRPVPWVQVDDDRAALAVVAANFYDRPTERLHVIGVTGTNGKTTTTYIIESILKAAGHPAAVFGTIEYRGPGFAHSAERTTPEASDLQSLFKRVLDGSWKHVVMEVSSHAIALKRVSEMHFDVAVFTNLSRDHLDFHGDMTTYFLEKKKLFAGLDGVVPRALVLNADDPHFQELHDIAPSHVISYGIERAANVHLSKHRFDWQGADAVFSTRLGDIQVRSPLIGRPNLYNMGAAIATAISLDIPLPAIRVGIENLPNVPGRFQSIDAGQPFRVIVDYAHTDDALEKLLKSVREITTGRVIRYLVAAGNEIGRNGR